MKFPFYQQDPTIKVALDLLGAELHHITPEGEKLVGRIVETEAYLGLTDPSCHSYHGKKTARVSTMYLPAGHAYIYLIYGMHLCFNVVTGDSATPEAVLIRALEPLKGIDTLRKNRANPALKLRDLCNGPGKLAKAFGLTMNLNGQYMNKEPLWIERPLAPVSEKIIVSSRIGLSPHQISCPWPLRFHLAGSDFVSRTPAIAPSTKNIPDLMRELNNSLKPRSWMLVK